MMSFLSGVGFKYLLIMKEIDLLVSSLMNAEMIVFILANYMVERWCSGSMRDYGIYRDSIVFGKTTFCGLVGFCTLIRCHQSMESCVMQNIS
jgi:hypothetical protein